MALTFTKETNGNITVRENSEIVKCLQPGLNVLCDPQKPEVLILSSTPNPYDEAGEFKFKFESVTLPTYSDKEDLISKLCSNFFDGGEISGAGGSVIYGDNQTNATISRTTSSVLFQAANTSRKELIVHNNSSGVLFLSFDSPAALGKGLLLAAKSTIFVDRSRTSVFGIWKTGGSGNASVTEITT